VRAFSNADQLTRFDELWIQRVLMRFFVLLKSSPLVADEYQLLVV